MERHDDWEPDPRGCGADEPFDAHEAWLEALDGPLGDELAALWDALDDLVTFEGAAGVLALLSDADRGGSSATALGGLPLFSLADPPVRAAFRPDLEELGDLFSGNAGVTPLGGPMALVHAALRGGERQRCAALLTFASARELYEIDQYDTYAPAGLETHPDEEAAADDGLSDLEWRYGAAAEVGGSELLVTVGVAPGAVPALLVLPHDPTGRPGFDPLFASCREEALRIAAVLADELG